MLVGTQVVKFYFLLHDRADCDGFNSLDLCDPLNETSLKHERDLDYTSWNVVYRS